MSCEEPGKSKTLSAVRGSAIIRQQSYYQRINSLEMSTEM